MVFLVITSSNNVLAHGGGLDSYGCHYDHKHGGYHCHRGQFTGQSFSSKAEMLQALKKPSGESGKGKSKK